MDYDIDYYENLLRIHSATAKEINQIRWDFIEPLEPKTVLDYGCGIGWFRAFRPEGVEVDTYDLMPVPQTGLRVKMYDVVCLWDVLEHIPDFSELEPVFALAWNIALTIPVKPPEDDILTWKHFKPNEHLHYWDDDMLDRFFYNYGFHKITRGQPECPPRKDIWSYVYSKTYNQTRFGSG